VTYPDRARNDNEEVEPNAHVARSLIWCALANWGGAVHMGGDLTFVLNDTRSAFATPASSTAPPATVGAWKAPVLSYKNAQFTKLGSGQT
jgi:hypothetical protein